jgi:DNA adenine methylase
MQHIPEAYNKYYEPFLGGAALFFALTPHPAFLSDTNNDLIDCYEVIRDEPDRLIPRLRGMKNSKKDYLRIRASKPTSDISRAARLLYLSSLAFNGIYRVNLRGEFNVPYGQKRHLDIVQESRIRAASLALRGSTLRCSDFRTAVASAATGDLVYLDPPYTVAHGSNGFLKYNAKIFSWADQTRLSETAADLDRRGCHVIITNASHASIRQLYPRFNVRAVVRPSRIAASAKFRSPVRELVFSNTIPRLL